jgi:hypothetical protein
LSYLASKLQPDYEKLEALSSEEFELLDYHQPTTHDLKQVFEQWAPTDFTLHKGSPIQSFDDPIHQKTAILHAQAAGIPFVLRNAEAISTVAAKWTQPYLEEQFGANVFSMHHSDSNIHRHFHKTYLRNETFKAPQEVTAVTYGDFIAQVKKLDGDTVYGIPSDRTAPFIKSDLAGVKSAFGWNKDLSTPWQCKIGVPSILNEAHFG